MKVRRVRGFVWVCEIKREKGGWFFIGSELTIDKAEGLCEKFTLTEDLMNERGVENKIVGRRIRKFEYAGRGK